MNRAMHKDGHYIWIESITTNWLGDDNIKAIVGNFRDITEHKLAEDKTAKFSRLYAFISQINQAIVHLPDELTLFKAACRIAIDIGKFEQAWISIPDTITRKLNLVAYSQMSEGELDMLNNISYTDNGSTGTVLRTGMPYVVNDFDDESVYGDAKRYAAFKGFRSGIALPIKRAGKPIGTYHIFSYKINLFDHEEIRLLEEAVGDISFALDVFEKEKHRRQMEERLNHSTLRLKQAQAIAHIGNWEMNFSTGNGEWSEEACRIYGVSPEDNMQSYQSWISYIHPDDLAHVLRIIKENEKTLTSSALHHRIILKNGAVKHIFTVAHFELNNEGAPVSIYGTAHDITDAKIAEQILAQSEANLTQILDLIPQSIFVKDFDGKYLFVNKSFAELYGLSAEQLLHKAVSEPIALENEAAKFLQQDREVILSGKSKILPEVSFTNNKGHIRLFHTIKVPFTVAETNEKAVLGITEDITEQKKADIERTKIIADMVQRNNDLEQFSYIISHNLRAPVANILGLVNIMQTIGLEKDEVENVTGFLQTAAQNLDHVIVDINNILELKNDVSAIRETVNLQILLNEIQSGTSSRITDEQAIINTDFLAAPEMITVKSYLYSIFYNLISNSLKYHRPGITPVIDITSLKTSTGIRIIFNDNGLGIDLKKNSADIFGLYKRFHHHVEGKGMGLFMIKTQVESLGGKITLNSEVNKGCCFVIDFEIDEISSD